MRSFILLVLSMALLSGCAAIPRKTMLTEMKTGEVCHGGFNLVTRAGWVVLPDGTKLTGKIFGVTDAQRTTHSFSGGRTGSSFTQATRGEGWCLLKSADGTQIMEIRVISNGMVTAGYGEATMNDGRSFRVEW
jgi:uncharacterized protein YceK